MLRTLTYSSIVIAFLMVCLQLGYVVNYMSNPHGSGGVNYAKGKTPKSSVVVATNAEESVSPSGNTIVR